MDVPTFARLSVGWWEAVDVVGLALVLVGVALERPPKWMSLTEELVERLAANGHALVTLGLAFELVATPAVILLNHREIGGLQAQVATADARAAEARRETAKLKNKTAHIVKFDTRMRAAAKKNRAIAEAHRVPRVLAKDEVLDVLRRRPKGRLAVQYVNDDSEALKLAVDLVDVFAAAGWNVEQPPESVEPNAVLGSGIMLRANPVEDIFGEDRGTAQSTLRKALAVGIGRRRITSGAVDPALAADEIRLIIGPRYSDLR